ncbi:Regulation of enolase protein 1, concanavalin A-like superfamily [Nonomuraea jiangxiensis]|uniref:Regulation of enolase protein 1, concanavalin A-like superfamily n=1 Tax=Nonomuraea jiangxiensis TaxID=633440 RepID=A0A1G9T3X4_9ACTN|nr:Regulation of enolase protein 1, concanavalin A-like superfamily [Nonomuraea jiangxiensis]
MAGVLAIAGVLSGCGTATSEQPPQTGPGVLTLENATAPAPGGEVGEASTEFADAADMKMWTKLSDTEKDVDRLAKYDVNKTAKGSMYLEPRTSAWFGGFRGPFVYQELAGDIVMYARVKVEGRAGGQPKRLFSLGGLMARQPGSYDKPNWVSITTGTAEKSGQVEVKYTQDGSSKPVELAVKPGWVDLVLGRVGRVFVALYREDKGQWKVGQRWPSTLPDVLQWGVTAYTDWDSYALLQKDPAKGNAKQVKGTPDLKLTVDFVRFLRPELPEYADPLNSASVSDEVLIKAMTPAGA